MSLRGLVDRSRPGLLTSASVLATAGALIAPGLGPAIVAVVVVATAVATAAWITPRLEHLLAVLPLAALVLPSPILVLPPLAAAALTAAVLIAWPGPRLDPAEALARRLLQLRLRRYPRLLEACRELAQCRERQQVAATVARLAAALSPETRRAAVFLADPAGIASEAASIGHGPAADQAAADHVLACGHGFSRLDDNELVVAMPLRERLAHGDTTTGVLVVAIAGAVTEEAFHREVQGTLARLGGSALGMVELLHRTREMAIRDGLTGLLGRHEFLRRLDEAVARSRRGQEPLAVVLCDMDHLKRYNDRFGHLAGDAALRHVARAIVAVIGSDALACRYGGEEFAFCLLGPAAEHIATIAERVRATVAATPPDGGPGETVTVSAGWARRQADETADGVLGRADSACYQAKDAGRNRVCGNAVVP